MANFKILCLFWEDNKPWYILVHVLAYIRTLCGYIRLHWGTTIVKAKSQAYMYALVTSLAPQTNLES